MSKLIFPDAEKRTRSQVTLPDDILNIPTQSPMKHARIAVRGAERQSDSGGQSSRGGTEEGDEPSYSLTDKGKRPMTRPKRSASPTPTEDASNSDHNPQYKRRKTDNEGPSHEKANGDVQQAGATSNADGGHPNAKRRAKRPKGDKTKKPNSSDSAKLRRPLSPGDATKKARSHSVPVFPTAQGVPHLDFRDPTLSPSRSRSLSKEFQAKIIPLSLNPLKALDPIPDEDTVGMDVEMSQADTGDSILQPLDANVATILNVKESEGSGLLAGATKPSEQPTPALIHSSQPAPTSEPLISRPLPHLRPPTSPLTPLSEASDLVRSKLVDPAVQPQVGNNDGRREVPDNVVSQGSKPANDPTPPPPPQNTIRPSRPQITVNTSGASSSRITPVPKTTSATGDKRNAFQVLMQPPSAKPVAVKGKGKAIASQTAKAGPSRVSTLRAPTAASLAKEKEKAAAGKQSAIDKPRPSIKAKMKPRGKLSKPALVPLPIPAPDEEEPEKEEERQDERVPTPPLEFALTTESRQEKSFALADKSMQDLTETKDKGESHLPPPTTDLVVDVTPSPPVDLQEEQAQATPPEEPSHTAIASTPAPTESMLPLPSGTSTESPSLEDEGNVPPRTRSKANKLGTKNRPAPAVSIPPRVTRSTRGTPVTEQSPSDLTGTQTESLQQAQPTTVADTHVELSPLFTPPGSVRELPIEANNCESQPPATYVPPSQLEVPQEQPVLEKLSPLPPSTPPRALTVSDLTELSDVPMEHEDNEDPSTLAPGSPMRITSPEPPVAPLPPPSSAKGKQSPVKSRLPVPKTPSRSQARQQQQNGRKTPGLFDKTPHSSPAKTYGTKTPKTPRHVSPQKYGRANARPNSSPSPTKTRVAGLGRSVSMKSIGRPAFTHTRNVTNPTTLSNLTSALEKLNVPRPERPNTSLGFNRDGEQGAETDTESQRGRGAAKMGRSKDDSVASLGKGRPSAQPSRASSVARSVKPASYAAPGSSTASTSSAASKSSTFRNKPQSMIQKPVTAFFNKPDSSGLGKGAATGVPGRNGRVVGTARAFGVVGGRVGPKASKRTSLPMVEASPVKGGGNSEQIRDGDDDDENMGQDTKGPTNEVGEDELFGGPSLAEGDAGAASSSLDKGKGKASDAWLKDRSRRTSLGLHALAQLSSTRGEEGNMSTPPLQARVLSSSKMAETSATSNPTTSVMGPPPSPRGPGRPGLRSATNTAKESPSSAPGGKPPSTTRTRARSGTIGSGSPASGSTPKGAGDANGNASSNLQFLKDCVVFVDVNSDTGEEAGGLFVDMLQNLGARLLSRVGSTCTHIVYKNGHSSTVSRWRQLKDPKPLVVGIAWVVECVEKRCKADETKFLIDLELVNVAGTSKRRRSILPKLLSATFEDMGVLDASGDGDNPEADQSMESNSSLTLDDNLTPLELARRRKSVAMGSRP